MRNYIMLSLVIAPIATAVPAFSQTHIKDSYELYETVKHPGQSEERMHFRVSLIKRNFEISIQEWPVSDTARKSDVIVLAGKAITHDDQLYLNDARNPENQFVITQGQSTVKVHGQYSDPLHGTVIIDHVNDWK